MVQIKTIDPLQYVKAKMASSYSEIIMQHIRIQPHCSLEVTYPTAMLAGGYGITTPVAPFTNMV